MKQMLCISLIFVVAVLVIAPPAAAVTQYGWYPNGYPSYIQPVNSGTVATAYTYGTAAAAYAAYCTNASTPNGVEYYQQKDTNRWFDSGAYGGLGMWINGTKTTTSFPTTSGGWDTSSSSTMTGWEEHIICQSPGGTLQNLYAINFRVRSDRIFNTSSTSYPVNFTGTPTTGSAPLLVTFTVTNTTSINATGMTWSFGDGNITPSGTATINHLYQNQGVYTVILNYFDITGVSKSVQKNNYITVGPPNATKTKWFQTIDGTNGNIVLNSSIQLKDVENSSWVNATELTSDGMSSITTLEGHHINAYAQALGYSDADDLNILNDGLPAYIMMWPTFAKNVSAGNVSLYVTVKDKDTRANIKGAGVTISPSSGSAQSTTTNDAGIAYFIVSNNTMVLITAQAIGQGYQTATTTINTGINSGGSASAAATILLGKNTVTPTFPTVTTLPGGGTPTATVTILPGCEDQISEEGQAKCRRAQSNQGLSFLSANMGDLIMLCVFVTMLYLLGFKLGK